MNKKLKQIIRRSISTKGQICIPAEFRPNNLDAYMVREDGQDELGNSILKLHPIIDETSENKDN